MHCKVLSAVLLASIAGGAGSAFAADLPVKSGGPAAAPVAMPPAYLSDWAGFYIGIHGGGGSGHTSFDPGSFPAVFSTATPVFGPPSLSPSGGVVGGQAGYNWQWGPVVGGLEIDFSGADLNATSTSFQSSLSFPFTTQTKIDSLASARGRIGYLVIPSLWLFGTAGLGYGHSQFNTTATTATVFLESSESDANEFGWVAGAGLEWKFWNHWLLRGEWLHYDFGRTSEFNEVFGININPRTRVDIGRAALSYKF